MLLLASLLVLATGVPSLVPVTYLSRLVWQKYRGKSKKDSTFRIGLLPGQANSTVAIRTTTTLELRQFLTNWHSRFT